MTDTVDGDSDSEIVALLHEAGTPFEDHPGFMRMISGAMVLHADWPAYPSGPGRWTLLETLAEYPVGTQFYPIDHIDHCRLFVVGRLPSKDPLSRQHLHIAIWDDDLRVAAGSGYLDGLQVDDEGLLEIRSKCLTLTSAAGHSILLHELTVGTPADLLEHVWSDLEAHRFDTAVRDSCVRLEVALKRAGGVEAFGQRLVDDCLGPNGCLVPSGMSNADRLGLRAAFRQFFAFVRNEYAHTMPKQDAITSCRHIRRCGNLMRTIDALLEAKRHESSPPPQR
jgi:hypothetical protein